MERARKASVAKQSKASIVKRSEASIAKRSEASVAKRSERCERMSPNEPVKNAIGSD